MLQNTNWQKIIVPFLISETKNTRSENRRDDVFDIVQWKSILVLSRFLLNISLCLSRLFVKLEHFSWCEITRGNVTRKWRMNRNEGFGLLVLDAFRSRVESTRLQYQLSPLDIGISDRNIVGKLIFVRFVNRFWRSLSRFPFSISEFPKSDAAIKLGAFIPSIMRDIFLYSSFFFSVFNDHVYNGIKYIYTVTLYVIYQCQQRQRVKEYVGNK